MIRLPNTGTYSLELITAQNGANVVVCYSDATSTAYTGGTQATAISSATTTTICATPAAATVRDIDEINIKNTYAGSHTITVQLDVAATNYPIITAVLLQDESLNYTHGSGWQAKDANGNTKASALTAMTSAQLAGIITDETGSGAAVFATSPVFVTPALGTPASGTLDSCTTNTEAANNNSTQLASTAYADRLIAGTLPGAFTTLDAKGDARFGTTSGYGYGLNSAEFIPGYYRDMDSVHYIAYTGYLAGTTRYRTTHIGNGKATNIATFDGPTGLTTLNYGLAVTGAISLTTNLTLPKTITSAGTTGAQTINKLTGTVNFAIGAASLVVTNSFVDANSVINCTIGTNDATMKSVQAIAAAGSFTIYPNAVPTAETRVNFRLTN